MNSFMIAAAWFHDTGILSEIWNSMKNKVVYRCGVSWKKTSGLRTCYGKDSRCIMATNTRRIPVAQKKLSAMRILIIWTYFITDELVGRSRDPLHFRFTSWHHDTLTLLQNTGSFTDYCRLLLKPVNSRTLSTCRKRSLQIELVVCYQRSDNVCSWTPPCFGGVLSGQQKDKVFLVILFCPVADSCGKQQILHRIGGTYSCFFTFLVNRLGNTTCPATVKTVLI